MKSIRRILSLTVFAIAICSINALAQSPAPQCADGPCGAVSPSGSNAAKFSTAASAGLGLFKTYAFAGDYASAGVGVRGNGSGTITIQGIPNGATIVAGYLYWETLGNGQSGSFSGHGIAGTPLGTTVSPCWPEPTITVYRADVTSLLAAGGNGSYAVTFPDSGDMSTAPSTEGASLIVVYKADGAKGRTILQYDGAVTIPFDGRSVDGSSFSMVISGFPPAPSKPEARITYVIGDGQGFGSSLSFNGSALTNTISGSNGPLWDNLTFDVSNLITTGDTQATTFSPIINDCLTFGAVMFSTSGPSIHSAELTQAIQEWQELKDLKTSLQNSGEPPVPVIAKKPGVLRVYMNQVDAVTNLRVDLSGAVTQSKQITLQPQCTPEMQRKATNGCQSADFYFVPPSGDFDVTVALADSSGNTLQTEDLPFKTRDADTLILKAASVCDSKDAHGVWQCAPANALPGDISKLAQIAPTDKVRVSVTNSVVRRDITTFGSDIDWWIAVTNDLNGMFGFFDRVADFFGGSHRTYFGMVRPNVQGGIGGMAHGIPSRAAAGRTSAIRLGVETVTELVGHETSHTLGGHHTNTDNPVAAGAPPGCYNLAGDPGTDWPFGDNRIQSTTRREVGFDVVARQPLDPDNTFDIMSYCVPRWISPFHYRQFMGALGATAPSSSILTLNAVKSAAPTAGQFWTVSGIIVGSSVQFDPLFQAQITGPTDAGSGNYQIQVQDSTGAILFTRFFNPETPETESTGPEVTGQPAFYEPIPFNLIAAKIIVLDPSQLTIGTLTLGGPSPVVTITSPTAGANVSGLQSISWTATNPNNRTLTAKVLYSPDNGKTLMQVGQLAGVNSLLVDFDTLPGAVGSAQIQVLVSDGINTGSATVAPFSVPKKANLTAEIVSPQPNAVYRKNDLVMFIANAYDVDDGILDDKSIQWTSNLDGVLGTGASLPLTTLQTGTHQITMTATDTDNNTITRNVTIWVAGPAPVMNLTVKNLDGPPTTCVQATINPVVLAGGVELAKIDYSLDGGTTFTNAPLASNPFVFIVPGSGSFHLVARAFDVAGQLAAQDARFSTASPCQNVDIIPPVTTASVTPSPNSNGWNNSDVTILLHAADNAGGSGVKQIQFSTTGAQSTSQVVAGDSASVTVSAEGTTRVTFFAVDNAGNQESAHNITIKLDKTPPLISGLPRAGSCVLWPPNHTLINIGTIVASDALSGLASFTLTGTSSEPTGSDPAVVITGSGLDSRTVQLRAERLGNGTGRTYTLQASSTDQAGNTTNVTATCVVPHDQGQ